MKATDRVPITVRLPAELVEKLRDSAVHLDESVEGVVETALRQFFEGKRIPKRKRRKLRPGPKV